MEYKTILIVLVMGAAIFSGCVDNSEKSIEGTYVSPNNAEDYFTLYNNDTYFLHYSSGATKTGYYVYGDGILVFKNYYAGSDYIFEQEYKNEHTFINNIGGRYVKK
jgi:hypothetical protein